MIDRRELLKWGVVAPVLAGAPHAAMAAMPRGVDALVVDSRLGEAARLSGPSAPRTYVIDGDVTALWYHTLDGIWRRPGFVLAGITGTDALFVLERLAVDRGRRVISRKELPAPGAAPGAAIPAASWVIAPVHPSVKV